MNSRTLYSYVNWRETWGSGDGAIRGRAAGSVARTAAGELAGLVDRMVEHAAALRPCCIVASVLVDASVSVAALYIVQHGSVIPGACMVGCGLLLGLLIGRLSWIGYRTLGELMPRLEHESSPALLGAALRIVRTGSAPPVVAAASRGLVLRVLEDPDLPPAMLPAHGTRLRGYLVPPNIDANLTAALLKAVERSDGHEYTQPVRSLCDYTPGVVVWRETCLQACHCLNILLECRRRERTLASLLRPAGPHPSETLLHAGSAPTRHYELLRKSGAP